MTFFWIEKARLHPKPNYRCRACTDRRTILKIAAADIFDLKEHKMKKIKIIIDAEYDEEKTYVIPEHVKKVFVDGNFKNVEVDIQENEKKYTEKNHDHRVNNS